MSSCAGGSYCHAHLFVNDYLLFLRVSCENAEVLHMFLMEKRRSGRLRRIRVEVILGWVTIWKVVGFRV